MSKKLPELLSVIDVCQSLGVSRGTLYNWERAGKFPERRKIGPHRVGWLRSEIEDHIENLPIGIDAAPRQLRETKMLKRKITRRRRRKSAYPRAHGGTKVTDPAELEEIAAQQELYEKSRG